MRDDDKPQVLCKSVKNLDSLVLDLGEISVCSVCNRARNGTEFIMRHASKHDLYSITLLFPPSLPPRLKMRKDIVR